ncbi:MAG: TonB-dependent receptor [Myxococcus sp.]|nr:TonB-dependent receptor [Myxococcus sp.]
MSNPSRSRIVTLAVALVASAAVAQSENTCALTGTVTDAAGKPLGGVVVTATSPSLAAARTLTTNDAGIYRIVELPPGTYALRFARPTYLTLTRADLELKLDRTLRINARLELAAAGTPGEPGLPSAGAGQLASDAGPRGADAGRAIVGDAGLPSLNGGPRDLDAARARDAGLLPSAAGRAAVEPRASADAGQGLDDATARAADGGQDAESGAPVVDATSAASGLTITPGFIDRVPLVRPNATGQRSFEALVQAAPQVTADRYGFGVSGGSSPENLYVIDGVTVNDPTFGSLRTSVGIGGAQLPLEFLERVDVITGGAGPELGRASGGVVNVVTKSGSNALHGSVWGHWWPGALTARVSPISDLGSSILTTTARHNTGDFGADLSGAVIKDRLWFYGGVAQSYDRQRVTRDVQRFLLTDDGSDFLIDETTGAVRTERLARASRFDDRSALTWIGKLTLRIAEGHTLAASMTGGPQRGVAPVFEPLAFGALLTTSESTTASLRYAGSFFDRHLSVSATLGWNRTDQATLPNDGSRPGDTTGWAGTPQTQLRRAPPLSIREFEALPPEVADLCEPAGFTATRRVTSRGLSRFVMACPVTGAGATYQLGGPGFLMESQADRLQARADATLRFELLGHHQVRAGADVEWTQARLSRATSGVVARVGSTPGGSTLDTADGAFLAGPNDAVSQLVVRAAPSQFATGLFVQDSWSLLDAVTLSAGLRYDTQQLFDSNGQLGLSLNNMLSPRVGLVYDFTGQGRSKVFANYAVLQQSLPLHLADRGLSGNTTTITRTGSATPLNADPLAPSPDVVRLGAGRLLVDPSLKPMANGELTAGLEYEVVSALRVGLIGTHRWLMNAVEDLSRDEGATAFIGNPGSGLGAAFPAAQRKYFAATLYASRAFTSGWLAQGSYTLSSLYGNYAGLFRPETGQLEPGLGSDFNASDLLENRTGPLPGDRTHQFKAYVAKDFEVSPDVTVLAGVSYEGLSGTPISFLAWHPTAGDDETFVLPRGAAGRTPWTHHLNVRGGVAWRVSKEQTLQVTLDVFNLLNLQEATEVSQRLSTAQVLPATVPDGKTASEAACLSGNSPVCQSVLQKQVNGAAVPVTTADLNGNFKQPTAFQAPLSVKLGLRLSF